METQEIEAVQQRQVAGTPRRLSSNLCSLLLHGEKTAQRMVPIRQDASSPDSQVIRDGRGLRDHSRKTMLGPAQMILEAKNAVQRPFYPPP